VANKQAANKQAASQKQKDTTAVREEPKKLPLTKIQTSGSNVPKLESVPVTGEISIAVIACA